MVYHILLIEILVVINQQDTPSFLSSRTPEITITRGQEAAAMKGCDFNFGCLKLLDWLDRLCIVHVDHHVEAGSCFF